MKLNYIVLFLFLVQYSTQSELCDNLVSWSNFEISKGCQDQLEIVCNNGSLLWRMFDASSKYPITGMSYTNNKDFGNFDECIDIAYEGSEGSLKGKHCAFSVAIVDFFLSDPIPDPYKLSVEPRNLAQLPKINQTYNRDLKALTPKDDITDSLVITALSLCIPDKCTPKEVGLFFLWGYFSEQDLPIVNFVEEVPCMTKDSNTDFKWGDILFTTVLALIGALIVASTTYDFVIQKLKKKPHHPLFLAFSWITNGKKLLAVSTTKNPEQISCLNGVRFISMMWVIAGHGFVAMEEAPIVNFAEVRGFIDNVKAMYIGAAPIAVDTFFFLSGFLLTFGYLKSQVKLSAARQISNIPLMIVHRYLRLTPAVAMLYFTAITIFRLTGTGPLWGAVSNLMSKQCTDHWWAFFLYVQNYVNYDDMCLNHTWYLSADMQMFILAPFVLIPLAELIKREKRNLAYGGLLCLIFLSTILPLVARFVDQTIDNTYETHERFNDYLIGMLLGVMMRDPKFQKFPFGKITNLAIWCFMFDACVAFIFYYHNVIRVYNHTSDTLFYMLYRPVWCFALLYLVYSCYHGFGGPVNWFLSLSGFQVGARLSYCMYLVHGVVEFYWVGLIRTPYYWGDYMIFYLWCGHFVVTMILSTVWSLAFESPMIVVEKFVFGGGRAKKPQKKEAAPA